MHTVLIRQMPWRAGLRVMPTLIGVVACLCIAARVDGAELWASLWELAHMPLLRWLGVAACVVGSILAMSRFDVLTHRLLNTGVPEGKAALAGTGAILATQFLGAGPVLAPLCRWWAMPERGLAFATKLSVVIFLGFASAIATVGAVAWVAAHDGVMAATMLAALLALIITRLPQRWRQYCTGMLCFAALDLVFVATSLWLLLPDFGTTDYGAYLPLFALGWMSGMLSALPGGAGGLDMVMIQALPHLAETELLAALMLWRLAALSVPGMAAPLVLWIARSKLPDRPAPTCPVARYGWHEGLAPLLHNAERAEAGLLRMPGMHLLHAGPHTMLGGRTLMGEVALFNAMRGHEAGLARAIRQAGQRQPLFYKLDARATLGLRRAGFTPLCLAEEAVIPLTQGFCLQGSARRQLRRKLRAAEKAGLQPVTGPLTEADLAEMAALDAQWQARNQGARGFSMGQFAPELLIGQRVVRILKDARLVAFVSFHWSASEWTLDLMRSADDCPDGAMHLAVYHGLQAAEAAGAARVSLAAVPIVASALPKGPAQWLAKTCQLEQRSAGLRQFKAAFAPRWERRYGAAASPLALVLGMVGVTLAVHAPGLNARLTRRTALDAADGAA